jgi:hypothetical protein
VKGRSIFENWMSVLSVFVTAVRELVTYDIIYCAHVSSQ